jgi:hypothetical protein
MHRPKAAMSKGSILLHIDLWYATSHYRHDQHSQQQQLDVARQSVPNEAGQNAV